MEALIKNTVPICVMVSNCAGHTHLLLGTVSYTPPTSEGEDVFVNDDGVFFRPIFDHVEFWN